jgi:ORF6N domain
MFQISTEEMEKVLQFVTPPAQERREKKATNSSQFVMSSRKHRGKRYRPYAFTEQGVAMLSSVLNSERAVKVNIAIMRAFVRLREALETNRELAQKFSELERRVGKHDEKIGAIIEAIRQLMAPPKKPRREIGFHVREKAPRYRAGGRVGALR